MAGRTQLEMAATDEQLREVADYMWEMALSIEDGDLSAAEKRLRQAQEALQAGAGEQCLRRGDRQADGRAAPGDERIPARVRRAGA